MRFSVFDPAQAAAASELALGLSVLAAASSDLVEGLDAVLTRASETAQTDDPELVHHALSLSVTHSREGRRLVKPRTVAAEPRKFPPSTLAAEGGPAALEAVAAGSTGTERPLDFWREDPLANEHHEHWHEVYPFSGLFPSDWRAWAASADRQGVRELLERLDPAPDWEAFLASADADAIADAFLRRAGAVFQQGQETSCPRSSRSPLTRTRRRCRHPARRRPRWRLLLPVRLALHPPAAPRHTGGNELPVPGIVDTFLALDNAAGRNLTIRRT